LEEKLTTLRKGHMPENIAFEEGSIMLVNKPLGWTSFDVVNRIKYAIKYNKGLKKIKVGHAGTLDPMADGLLIICTGKYTKKLEFLSTVDKSYLATVKLGATTPSFDRESEEENIKSIDHITKKSILDLVSDFMGITMQQPPIFSAIKIKGQTAYALARKGKDVVIEPRKITITKFDPLEINLPLVTLDLAVSKGTYIRSIANDMGVKLGVGAYLYGLTRTSIGQYLLQDALEIDDVVAYIKEETK
jgi:tRNA pseudouridine55 synthase